MTPEQIVIVAACIEREAKWWRNREDEARNDLERQLECRIKAEAFEAALKEYKP